MITKTKVRYRARDGFMYGYFQVLDYTVTVRFEDLSKNSDFWLAVRSPKDSHDPLKLAQALMTSQLYTAVQHCPPEGPTPSQLLCIVYFSDLFAKTPAALPGRVTRMLREELDWLYLTEQDPARVRRQQRVKVSEKTARRQAECVVAFPLPQNTL